MTQREKTLEEILRGKADANIRFVELRSLLLSLGFSERTRGSHHVFSKKDIDEQIVLQQQGSKAKAYQVRQVRSVLIKYHLAKD
ncbi:MAG TPA: type II toxin-antitoxin system HicA family toxin [Thermoanaerobaculia bacterium]|jgi:predicted RNA binding protein YcfA (HicA-like mRNA interferase family)|nr:type II toxin-antitoxin system HicA family toxin [Thermoanaerobaculia bacterium]